MAFLLYLVIFVLVYLFLFRKTSSSLSSPWGGGTTFKPVKKAPTKVRTNFTPPEKPVIQFGLDTVYQPGGNKKHSISD